MIFPVILIANNKPQKICDSEHLSELEQDVLNQIRDKGLFVVDSTNQKWLPSITKVKGSVTVNWDQAGDVQLNDVWPHAFSLAQASASNKVMKDLLYRDQISSVMNVLWTNL